MGTVRQKVKRLPSRKRVEKSEAVRARLIETAAKIIGKYGYAGCSIARITQRAGVAHGAFYLYFKSQQALFDEILPTLGAVMLDTISDAIRDSKDLLEVERKGLEANFAYLSKQQYMYRVLHEAELYAPKAFQKHFNSMIERYRRSLHRSLSARQITNFSEADLDTLAAMLIGARDHILTLYAGNGREIQALHPKTVDAYIRFVAHGLGVPDEIA